MDYESRIKHLEERCAALERIIERVVQTQTGYVEALKLTSDTVLKNSKNLVKLTNTLCGKD